MIYARIERGGPLGALDTIVVAPVPQAPPEPAATVLDWPRSPAGIADAESTVHSPDGRWVARSFSARSIFNWSGPTPVPIPHAVLRDLDARAARITLVWRCEGALEQPWLFLTVSAVLLGVTPIESDPGLGLYAWRDFELDEVIAPYHGRSLGFFDEDDEEGIAAAVSHLGPGKDDKVVEFERPREAARPSAARPAACTRASRPRP